MADFTMTLEIIAKARKSISEVDKFKKKLKDTEREYALLGKTLVLDSRRIAQALTAVTLQAGLMFAAMLAASPALRAAFIDMSIAAFEMSLVLGEELAPMIEATLVPAVNKLRDDIIALDEPYREWIALTITLTFVIGLLVIAIAALSVEMLIIAGIVIGVAAVFAAVFVILTNFGVSIEDATNVLLLFAAIIGVVALILGGPVVVVVIGLIALIILLARTWGTITDGIIFFGKVLRLGIDMVRAMDQGLDSFTRKLIGVGETVGKTNKIMGIFMTVILTALAIALQVVGGIIITIIDLFATLNAVVGDILIALGLLFKGDIKGFLLALATVVVDILNFIIRFFNRAIDVMNKALEGADTAAKIFGGSVDFRIPKISEEEAKVPTFGEGGTVQRTGLIFAHKKEEVLRPVEAREFRKSKGRGEGNITINNTFNIANIRDKRDMKAIAMEVERVQKRQMNKRSNI